MTIELVFQLPQRSFLKILKFEAKGISIQHDCAMLPDIIAQHTTASSGSKQGHCHDNA